MMRQGRGQVIGGEDDLPQGANAHCRGTQTPGLGPSDQIAGPEHEEAQKGADEHHLDETSEEDRTKASRPDACGAAARRHAWGG